MAHMNQTIQMREDVSRYMFWSLPLYDQTGPENDSWECRDKAIKTNLEEFKTVYMVEYMPPWNGEGEFPSLTHSYMLIL